MDSRRLLVVSMLASGALLAAPCPAQEAISRALTVNNLPDVPPDPVTEAVSRPWTVYNLPDVPPDPVTEAVSRPWTVYNLPDPPPDPITEAVSRPLTVYVDPLSSTDPEDLPRAFALAGARPNPFNPVTTIRFDVPRPARVHLKVFDVSGSLVAVLLDGDVVQPGRREAVWDGRDLAGRAVASGVYFCHMSAGSFRASLPVTLLK